MSITLGSASTNPAMALGAAGACAVTITGTTAGNGLIIGVYWFDSGGTKTISSVSVSGESNATIHSSKATLNGGSTMFAQFASLAQLSAGGSHTVTATFSVYPGNSSCGIFALEVAGMHASTPFDTQNSGTGASGGFSITLTTAVNNEAIVLFGQYGSAGGETPQAGYTAFDLPNVSLFWYGDYNLDVGTAGSKTATATVSGAWGAIAGAFQPAATAARKSLLLTGTG